MITKRIYLLGIILSCSIILAGCGSQTIKQSKENQLENSEKEAAARELERAQEMQLAAIKVQDENVTLKAKVDELTSQLTQLRDEFDAYKKKMAEPEKWEEKYKKLEADNEVLRKLVQYERGIQEDLMKKVQADQATINELKSKLNE